MGKRLYRTISITELPVKLIQENRLEVNRKNIKGRAPLRAIRTRA